MMSGLSRRWRKMADRRRLSKMDERLLADMGLSRDTGFTCPTEAQRKGQYAVFRIHTS